MRQMLLFLSIVMSTLTAQGDSAKFFSPSHKFTVIFVKDTEVIYDRHSQDIDEISYIRYKILFVNNKTKITIVDGFTDVYGNHNPPKHTPLKDIFSQFEWSPAEDFVELPEDDWPRAPGAVESPTVNLNPNYNWKSTTISIDSYLWLDSLRVVGTCYDDCFTTVQLFDGSTGNTIYIKHSMNSVGYGISSKTTDTLYVESVLEEGCANEEQIKTFKPSVIAIPISYLNKLAGIAHN